MDSYFQQGLFPLGSSGTDTGEKSAGAGKTEEGFSNATESVEGGLPFAVSLLALSKVKGLGRKGLQALVKVYGDRLGTVFQAPREKTRQMLHDAKTPRSDTIADVIVSDASGLVALGKSEVYSLAAKRVYVIGPADLPDAFRKIPDGPPWLFVHGDPYILQEGPFVAVVGTRKPTEEGRQATRAVVRQLAAYDIVLVSGLAEGIDEEAHAASLSEGVPNVAFLGHGINFSIPASTKDLRARIVKDGGAVVTEYLPDEHFQKSYFVQRNRLQAALANLVIPVEANPSGGTAHTVRFARKYGRKLLGIWWAGANGILEDLQRDGYPSVDIFSAEGRKTLDSTFRTMAENAGQDTYSLHLAQRQLLNEMRRRNVRPEDLDRLIEFLGHRKDDRSLRAE